MKLPRLRQIRESRGLSQSKLAREARVSRDSISNYETGQREAWPATAKRLADALGVEITDLRPAEGEVSGSEMGAPQLERRQFAEYGIEPTDAEIATLNAVLKLYTEMARSGDGGPRTLTIPEGPVDMERVYLLIDFALMRGILTPQDVAVLRDGVHAKLVKS